MFPIDVGALHDGRCFSLQDTYYNWVCKTIYSTNN